MSDFTFGRNSTGVPTVKIAGHVFVLPSSERTMPINVTYHGIVLVAMVNIYNGSIHDKYRQVTKGVRNLSFHIGGKSRKHTEIQRKSTI